MIYYFLGEPVRASEYLKQGLAAYRRHSLADLSPTNEADLAVFCLSYTAIALWMLGYSEQAYLRSEKALSLARKLARPSLIASTLHIAFWVHRDWREVSVSHALVEALVRLCQEQEFPFWLAGGRTHQGWY